MKETIFDLIEPEIKPTKESYMDVASRAPQPKEKSFFNDIKDYAKTIGKGTIEGLGRLGRIMGPLDTGRSTQKQLEEQTENLNELLPTDEGFIQKGLRRGLKEAPSVAASPFGSPIQSLTRSLGAGYAGETSKELGAPEWVQTAAELTAYIGPDVTKKLLEKGSNKEIIAEARKLGMSDEAITPLIQSDFKQKWLSSLTGKGNSTQEALDKTKKELSNVYSSIQNSPDALNVISEKGNQTLMKSFSEKLYKMPSEVRNKIKEDFQDLVSRPITGESLINFYSDINHYLSDNAKQLSLLKDPIKQALKDISPKLGKDFETINNLYTKFYPIQKKLKPTLASQIVKGVEAVGGISAVLGSVFGYYQPLLAIVGEKSAKKIAQQMLLNPNFQQIGQKMAVALNQNKMALAQKLSKEFKNEISKFNPEAADKFENFSVDEFKYFISNQEK